MVTDRGIVPASLPDGKEEIYGYVAIAGHDIGKVKGNPPSRKDRLRNADSYAFLAMGTSLEFQSVHIYDTN
jgi:hypothetical protein